MLFEIVPRIYICIIRRRIVRWSCIISFWGSIVFHLKSSLRPFDGNCVDGDDRSVSFGNVGLLQTDLIQSILPDDVTLKEEDLGLYCLTQIPFILCLCEKFKSRKQYFWKYVLNFGFGIFQIMCNCYKLFSLTVAFIYDPIFRLSNSPFYQSLPKSSIKGNYGPKTGALNECCT